MFKIQNKVVIIGCGLVGSSVAFSLLTQGICNEIMMVDKNEEKAKGEVRDLNNCIEYLNRNVKVTTGRYEDCKDADIVVIAAGDPPKVEESRFDMLEVSAKIVKTIVEPVMNSGFDGIFINISNPVDVITQYIYQLSGLPKNQVIGTGTALDSARLKNLMADMFHVDSRSIYAYTMGEHGDSQMVPWSVVKIGGKSFFDTVSDNPNLLKGVELDELLNKIAKEGWEIYSRKADSYYGIATTAVSIIKAILHDENRIIPVSAYLEGEYDLTGVYCSVPCVLNRTGAADVLEVHMTSGELAKLHQSAHIIFSAGEEIF